VTACRACLDPVPANADGGYHPRCLKALFGVPRLPRVGFELRTLHTVGLEIAGKVALSGVQRKVAVRLDGTGRELVPAPEASRFILKPQAQAFPHVPENEHLTMRLASRCGIESPPCALLPLADGSIAYVVRRFDRTDEGRKVRMEDFCQLAEQPTKDRYQGSAEMCARLVRRYASEPLIDVLRLFRQTLFSWWVGNGDMHLKNLSLVAGADGRWRLSPAYDLLDSEIILGADDLALSVGGKKRNLTARIWREYGAYCGLPEKVVRRELARVPGQLAASLEVVGRSALPDELKAGYAQGLSARAAVIS
jgi:serine/threonine-protein kinase HipA